MSLNKKGTVIDLIPHMIIFIAVFITMFVAVIVWNDFSSDDNLRQTSYQNASMDNTDVLMQSGLDNLFLLLFFGISIAVVITAALVRSNALFFIVSFIAWIIILLIGLFTKYIYEDLIADANLASVSGYFPKTIWVMDHILITAILFGILIMISMLAGSRFAE